MKFSIIVPVYNAEKYLEKCIFSVLKQTYEKFELILVDNCSSDNSVDIIKKNMKEDRRIKFYSEKKKGVSNARNLGLSHVSGDYILFIDSDDYVSKDYLSIISKNLSNNDFLIFGYKEKYLNGLYERYINSVSLKRNDFINLMFNTDAIGGFVWNKVYKTEIIKNKHLKFSDNINMCEDLLFNISYLNYINDVMIINNSIYNYRIRKNSISKNNNKTNSIVDCFENVISILDYYDNKNIVLYYFLILFMKEKKLTDKAKKFVKNNYYKVLNSKSITLKKKIKLIIMNRFKFVYSIYILNKNKKYNLYD